ncbi:MAG TPA: EamA family transporter [Bacillota bacterium]|nr:EamA family transporter [Bacillota bacterium]
MGLFYESTFLIPLALPVIIIFEANGKGALAHGDVKQILLLLLIGGVTAIPLGLFGVAARKADFTVLGITAYLDPTISLLLGIFLYKEQVNFQMLVGFIAIWIGIIFFTVDQIRRRQNSYR